MQKKLRIYLMILWFIFMIWWLILFLNKLDNYQTFEERDYKRYTNFVKDRANANQAVSKNGGCLMRPAPYELNDSPENHKLYMQENESLLKKFNILWLLSITGLLLIIISLILKLYEQKRKEQEKTKNHNKKSLHHKNTQWKND